MIRKIIGKRIKIARIEQDKSQEWLAEQFDVSQKTVSAWEAGRNPVESALLGDIANVLGKPVAWFYQPFEAVSSKNVEARQRKAA